MVDRGVRLQPDWPSDDDLEALRRHRCRSARTLSRRLVLLLRLGLATLTVTLHDETVELKAVLGHAVADRLFLRLEPLAHAGGFGVDHRRHRVALDADGD